MSDKRNIVELAQKLDSLGVEILSTGGTATLLNDNGIDVVEVSDFTGFPEIMDGRVKTLHPKIAGGLLGRRGQDENVMRENNILPIDLVVVNLYPFRETIARDDCTLEQAIENIDIGGPTMLRAAAKNYKNVCVVVDSTDYERIINDLEENDGAVSDGLRFDLAVKAFEHTAAYDGAIANYLGLKTDNEGDDKFSRTYNMQFHRKQVMRYGENPHQKAAFYVGSDCTQASVSGSSQIQGKALSFNNIADTDAALECVKQFTESPACVIVKHANPCGVAVSQTLEGAYGRAFSTDPESAFGGIIAVNTELDQETAKAIIEKQFVEVIIAPEISDAAKQVLLEKENIRVLVCGNFEAERELPTIDYKRVNGGLLVQEGDEPLYQHLDIVTERSPSEQEMEDLVFAWQVAKFVKSNAIVYAGQKMTLGVGAGQMSRVNSARIAAIKAEHAKLDLNGAVMASDAFFPFRDGIDNAADVGISAVIQPGGSMRDKEVIEAANEHGIAMVYTGMRHFRH